MIIFVCLTVRQLWDLSVLRKVIYIYIPTLTHLKFSLGDLIRERSQDLYAMFISLTVHVLKVTRDTFCKRLLKKRKKWVTNLMWDLNVNSSYLIRTNAVIPRQSHMTMRVILTWHRLITAKIAAVKYVLRLKIWDIKSRRHITKWHLVSTRLHSDMTTH